MHRLRRILHPTDLSRASRAGFARAMSMARAERAKLLVVHVVTPPVSVVGNGYMSPQMHDAVGAAARKHADDRLRTLQGKARREGVRASTLVVQGAAAQQIMRTARAKKADLIVMGTHGRTWRGSSWAAWPRTSWPALPVPS